MKPVVGLHLNTRVASTFYVHIAGPTSSAATAKKIREFSALPRGWYYGMGTGPSPRTIHIALAYLSALMVYGFSETDAFPGGDGEIMITAYSNSHCIEVTVDVDTTFTVSHQDGKESRFYEPGLSGIQACAELARIVEIIRQEECATSESFISSTTTMQSAASSRTWLWDQSMVEFPYFWSNVGYAQAEIPAPTYSDFTRISQDHHTHFGNLIPPFWTRPAL
jgi:hypothetical protein